MINDVTFIGNLTKKPELRTINTKNGDQAFVTTLTIAVDRRKSGIPMDGTDFFDITVWNKAAENCVKYLDKGSRVHIKGYVIITSSEKDGQRRFFTQFTGQRVTFLSRSGNTSETRNISTEPTNDFFTQVDSDDTPF